MAKKLKRYAFLVALVDLAKEAEDQLRDGKPGLKAKVLNLITKCPLSTREQETFSLLCDAEGL